MEKLFYWTLGASVVLLGISAIFLLIAERRKKKLAQAAFDAAGASLTTRIGDLWLDEDKELWLVAREDGETPVHRFSDVLGASLSEDGVQYIWKNNGIFSAEGNDAWPPQPDERGKYKVTKRPSAIYLNIFVKKPECPVETIVLLGRPCSRTSRMYMDAAAKTAALMRLFNTVCPPQKQKKKK
jgi:hypothetical protein